MKPRAKEIFWNAMLLTAASILMRTVGVGFQVYISNRVGAEAMGLYSLLGGVYGFALTVAASGIHLGVTRLTVDAVGGGHPERVPTILKKSILHALVFGVGAMVLLLVAAEPVGTYWLCDERTIRPLRIMGLTLPAIALSSAWGGYFTAMRRTYKNAAVQVIEQAIRIFGTVWLLTAFSGGGVEETCCLLAMGGVISEGLSFLAELALFLRDKRKNFPDRGAGRGEGRKLLSVTMPVAFTAYIRSALLTVEHILIPRGLRGNGATRAAALSAYGCIHGMAFPIILYPAALIGSFAGLLVPEVAESAVQNRTVRIRYMIGRVWGLTLLYSIGIAGILACFSREIGELLYPSTGAATYIRLFAPLIPIMYLDTATDAMLKGMGEQVYSMKVNVADAAISVVLVWILVPRMGIAGYPVTVYFSETFNTVCSVTRLLRIGKPPIRLFKWIYKPLFCIVAATAAARGFFAAIGSGNGASAVVLHIFAAAGLYLLLLCLVGVIGREDRGWISTLFETQKPLSEGRNRLDKRGGMLYNGKEKISRWRRSQKQ